VDSLPSHDRLWSLRTAEFCLTQLYMPNDLTAKEHLTPLWADGAHGLRELACQVRGLRASLVQQYPRTLPDEMKVDEREAFAAIDCVATLCSN